MRGLTYSRIKFVGCRLTVVISSTVSNSSDSVTSCGLTDIVPMLMRHN
nr:MAG TPA: hypothetical protein [Caudoviricetes sp.]DAH76312.1 MAG TPA: hypothetical protein [Caudoviricetes sp.]